MLCSLLTWLKRLLIGPTTPQGFSSEERAATAYDLMALRCRGDRAQLNFGAAAYDADRAWLAQTTKQDLVHSLRRATKPAGGTRHGLLPRRRNDSRSGSQEAPRSPQPPPTDDDGDDEGPLPPPPPPAAGAAGAAAV